MMDNPYLWSNGRIMVVISEAATTSLRRGGENFHTEFKLKPFYGGICSGRA